MLQSTQDHVAFKKQYEIGAYCLAWPLALGAHCRCLSWRPGPLCSPAALGGAPAWGGSRSPRQPQSLSSIACRMPARMPAGRCSSRKQCLRRAQILCIILKAVEEKFAEECFSVQSDEWLPSSLQKMLFSSQMTFIYFRPFLWLWPVVKILQKLMSFYSDKETGWGESFWIIMARLFW